MARLLISCAEKTIPADVDDGRVSAHPLINVVLNNDWFPHLILPGDIDAITVKMVNHGLTNYILAAWGMYLPFQIHDLLIT